MKSSMKKIKNLIIALFLVFTFVTANIAAMPVTTQASGTPAFAKTIGIEKGNTGTYGIGNSVKSDKILNLKSSNTSVATVKSGIGLMGDREIIIKGKKQGTATLSFTLQRKNGKKYTFKSKITVFTYSNPLKKCVFAGKDYAKQFDKKKMIGIFDSPSSVKGKINIVAKKGYKIESIYYYEHGGGAVKKIKNGSSVALDGQHYLEICCRNTSKNYLYSLILDDIV